MNEAECILHYLRLENGPKKSSVPPDLTTDSSYALTTVMPGCPVDVSRGRKTGRITLSRLALDSRALRLYTISAQLGCIVRVTRQAAD